MSVSRVSNQYLIAGLLFVMALATRLPSLTYLLTVDEPRWMQWSTHFVAGLLWPDYECPAVDHGRTFSTQGWGCTFQVTQPGVTTMWLAGLGLLSYYALYQPEINLRAFLTTHLEPFDFTILAWMRLPLVIVAALFFPLFYLLLRRLWPDSHLPLIATLLTLFQPFHIAHSRVIHHDALATTFMSLAGLMMLGYWLRGWSARWLVGAAMLSGLAILSKPLGLFMVPYAGVVAGLSWLQPRVRSGDFSRPKPTEVDTTNSTKNWLALIGWGVMTLMTIVLLFPAVWVMPRALFQEILTINAALVDEGHSQYFWGHVSDDPGWLYYPVVWLFRSTPLELLGLALFIGGIVYHASARSSRFSGVGTAEAATTNFPAGLIALAIFIVGLLLFETASPKKQDRYFLIAFPMINILVAAGWLWFINWFSKGTRHFVQSDMRHTASIRRLAEPLLIGLIILGQAGLAMWHYPHYLTYYNPLLGGPNQAATMLTVGWGEGQSDAAAYLNQKPQAESLRVAVAGYGATFKPYFKGDTVGGSSNRKTLAADYMVYYRSLIQRISTRDDYRPGWLYFQRHYQPTDQTMLHGLAYAVIYQSPVVQHLEAEQNHLTDQLDLFGYTLEPAHQLRLFWQSLTADCPCPPTIKIALSSAHQTAPLQWQACPLDPAFSPANDLILESVCPLGAEADGIYNLHVGLAPQRCPSSGRADFQSACPQNGDESGTEEALQTVAPFGLAFIDMVAGQARHLEPELALNRLAEQAQTPQPLTLPLNESLWLLGYQFEPSPWQAGSLNRLTFWWQLRHPPDFAIINHLQIQLRLEQAITRQPLLTADRVADYQGRGAVVPVVYQLETPADLPAGNYPLEVCLMAATELVEGGSSEDGQETVALECISLPVTIQ